MVACKLLHICDACGCSNNIVFNTKKTTCSVADNARNNDLLFLNNQRVPVTETSKYLCVNSLASIENGERKNRQRHGRSTRRVNKTQKRLFRWQRERNRECARDLNDPNQQNEIFRIAKQMVKERRHNRVKLSERCIRQSDCR